MGLAGLVDLKKRINSIQNTKKLTRAMALVATSKLKKARVGLEKNNLYLKSYRDIVTELKPLLPKENKYIKSSESNKTLVIIVTSDLGMCGSYNFNLVNKAQEIINEESYSYKFLAIGEKGRSLLKRYKFDMVDFQCKVSDIPTTYEAEQIFDYALQEFLEHQVGRVAILYTFFKNPLVKEPVYENILPFQLSEEMVEMNKVDEFDIEGDKEEVFNTIVPSYCNSVIYNALVNAKTSEQSYRMETMNSASQNAGDLISSLELKYNRIRQSAITQEISEIVGGSEAQI